MKSGNLGRLMLAIVVAAAVCRPAGAAASELDVAHQAWLECVRAAIPQLDHPESTSETIARAAMNRCADQYAEVVRVLSRSLVPSCAPDSDCTREALAKAQSEATRIATDEVVTARIRVAGAQVLVCQ